MTDDVRAADLDCEPLVGASAGQAMQRFISHAFRIRGRASRSEYWWWMLVNLMVVGLGRFVIPWITSDRTPNPTMLFGPFGSLFFANIPLFTVGDTPAPDSPVAAFALIVAGIWIIVTVIPGITVLIRRLHDSNMSGFWWLLAVLPLGTVLLLLFALRRSRPEGARFDA
ncbi:DUF805 domain-containing protein [Microbacterium sp. BWT-B31]|uniref:DUF805 domain-containing protein n=1 Tax=Microbacterium sp. BWT-B31 TaxID=3232072 RepID=UPI0035298AA8